MINEEKFANMTPARQKRVLMKKVKRMELMEKRRRNREGPVSMPNPVPEGFDYWEDKKQKEKGLGHGKRDGKRYDGRRIFRTYNTKVVESKPEQNSENSVD